MTMTVITLHLQLLQRWRQTIQWEGRGHDGQGRSSGDGSLHRTSNVSRQTQSFTHHTYVTMTCHIRHTRHKSHVRLTSHHCYSTSHATRHIYITRQTHRSQVTVTRHASHNTLTRYTPAAACERRYI